MHEERHPGHEPTSYPPESKLNETQLALLSEEDRQLATRFESVGGVNLCLSHAFTLPDKLREEAKRILKEAGEEDKEEALWEKVKAAGNYLDPGEEPPGWEILDDILE